MCNSTTGKETRNYETHQNREENIKPDARNDLGGTHIDPYCVFRLFNLRYHCTADLLLDSESNDMVWLLKYGLWFIVEGR